MDKKKFLEELKEYKRLMLKGYGLRGSKVDIIIHLIKRIEKGDFDTKEAKKK